MTKLLLLSVCLVAGMAASVSAAHPTGLRFKALVGDDVKECLERIPTFTQDPKRPWDRNFQVPATEHAVFDGSMTPPGSFKTAKALCEKDKKCTIGPKNGYVPVPASPNKKGNRCIPAPKAAPAATAAPVVVAAAPVVVAAAPAPCTDMTDVCCGKVMAPQPKFDQALKNKCASTAGCAIGPGATDKSMKCVSNICPVPKKECQPLGTKAHGCKPDITPEGKRNSMHSISQEGWIAYVEPKCKALGCVFSHSMVDIPEGKRPKYECKKA